MEGPNKQSKIEKRWMPRWSGAVDECQRKRRRESGHSLYVEQGGQGEEFVSCEWDYLLITSNPTRYLMLRKARYEEIECTKKQRRDKYKKVQEEEEEEARYE